MAEAVEVEIPDGFQTVEAIWRSYGCRMPFMVRSCTWHPKGSDFTVVERLEVSENGFAFFGRYIGAGAPEPVRRMKFALEPRWYAVELFQPTADQRMIERFGNLLDATERQFLEILKTGVVTCEDVEQVFGLVRDILVAVEAREGVSDAD